MLIYSDFENCTRCNNPPGYTIIPPEDDDPGLFGCCDANSIAIEKNRTCIKITTSTAIIVSTMILPSTQVMDGMVPSSLVSYSATPKPASQTE